MEPPVRTCIGCRERAAKADLMRLVWRDGIVVDDRQTAPGRGAYLHPSSACLAEAVKRRSLARALRVTGADSAALTETVRPRLDGEEESAQQVTSRNRAPVT